MERFFCLLKFADESGLIIFPELQCYMNSDVELDTLGIALRGLKDQVLFIY